MTSADGYTPPQLRSFFVFNPKFGTSEDTEEEKLLFYYPTDLPMDVKMSEIGLAEALINFTGQFSPKKPCEAVHLKKRTHAFFQPEPHFWIVMTVTNATTAKKGADGQTVLEVRDMDSQDAVLQAIVQQVYKQFKLFNGSLAWILEKFSLKTLRLKLELGMPGILDNLSFKKLDVFSALSGVQFLPVDRHTFTNVQFLINVCESQHNQVKSMVFLYDNHLVWSGLGQEETRTVFHFLKEIGSPQGRHRAATAASATETNGFIMGPEDCDDPSTSINVPLIFVNAGSPNEASHAVVYQSGKIIIMLVVDPDALGGDASAVDPDASLLFYQSLQNFFTAELPPLAKKIQEQYGRVQSEKPDESYRFVYYNRMNLAIKASAASKWTTVPREVMNALTQVHSDMNSGNHGNVNEVFFKTGVDWWVGGRRSEQREFFVLVDQKNTNLTDIQDEMDKLHNSYFSNIFTV